MSDGSLCLHFPRFSSSHATAVALADAAVIWLASLELFIETGQFPRHTFPDQPPKPGTQRAEIYLESIMGDVNIAGQAGAQGSRAVATGNTFNQVEGVVMQPETLAALVSELRVLREEMLRRATEPEHYQAIADVAGAERAAQAGESRNVTSFLKRAGQWSLDTASKIGAEVTSGVIRQAMGLE
jgi:hypothetical protein